MQSTHIGSATTDPDCLDPSVFFSSNPTHTAAVRESEAYKP